MGDSMNCRKTDVQTIRNAQLINHLNNLKWVMRIMFRPHTAKNTGMSTDENPNHPLTMNSDALAPRSPVLFSISAAPFMTALWSVPPLKRNEIYATRMKMAMIVSTAPLVKRNVSLRNVSDMLERLNFHSGFWVPVRGFVSFFEMLI